MEWPLTVTASLASWLIERVQQVEEESQVATRRDVAALSAQVAALTEALDRRDEDVQLPTSGEVELRLPQG